MRRLTAPLARLALWGQIGVVCGCIVFMAGLALAHSPYLSPRADWVYWSSPDEQPYSLAVLWGDGILAANPLRSVVLDAEGQVVALGPLVTDAYIHCRTPLTDCIIFLDLRPLRPEENAPAAVTPDPSGFRWPRSPDFYPEQTGEVPYGFKAASLTVGDHWVAWTISYRRNPLAVVWTLLLVWLGLRLGGAPGPAWRIAQHLPAFLPLRILGFAVALAGLMLATLVIPLIWAFFSLLEGSLLKVRPNLAAFAVAVAIGLWRSVARIIAPPPQDGDGIAAGAAS